MGIQLIFMMIFAATIAEGAVYGTDSRREPYEVPGVSARTPAIAMMQSDVFVKLDEKTNTYNLDFPLATDPFGADLCQEEKFSDQRAGYLNCTGFLVAEDILVTAGHCMIYSHSPLPKIVMEDEVTPMCESFLWMFDYQRDVNKKESVTGVSPDSVYRCKKVVYAELFGYTLDSLGEILLPVDPELGEDFAIIQLDRKVTGREPLKLTDSPVPVMERIHMLGYPMALPLKYAGDARVIDAGFSHYLIADLDVISGNSGGPVFNSADEVVGLAVRSFPGEDFTYDSQNQCLRVYTCPEIGKKDCVNVDGHPVGSHINRISPVIKKLKELQII